MYNITSTNEKETFSFHDCFILETKHINDDIIIFLSHVDVLKNNSENHTDSAKQTDKAMLKIYDLESIIFMSKYLYLMMKGNIIKKARKYIYH